MKTENPPIICEEIVFPEKWDDEHSAAPVLKINPEGKILYANSASFELLRSMDNNQSDFLPGFFKKTYASVYDPSADLTISLNVNNEEIKLDVVGFPECGYIGLYATELISLQETQEGNYV